MSTILNASDISMRFNDRILFHIPTLMIGPNDAIYLKGDNGVGKTTLLKILAGLLTPTTGKVTQSAQTWVQQLIPFSGRKEVIYLHQSPYLFDGSVFDNVNYGIRFHHEDRHQKRAKVIKVLRMAGLDTLINEHISVLSGGEKQRVAMARAWILNPSILLMDEPSASLDQESIERLVLMSQDLLDNGSSLVITSHQSNALTQLCKKQWWITEKTLVESPQLQLIASEYKQGEHNAVTKSFYSL